MRLSGQDHCESLRARLRVLVNRRPLETPALLAPELA